MLIKIFHMD